jgi:putative transcriptional regulator
MKPGTLLISKPFLGDPNFERSVVLLCRYSPAEGAFGLVLTRPLNTVLGDVLELPLGAASPAADLPLYEGGPVQPDTLHVVHQLPGLPGATPLGSDTYWGGDFDELLARLTSGAANPAAVRLFVGYSGWSAGQLEGEIEQGSWIRQPASAGKVFTLNSDTLWQGVLREKGGRYRALSNYPLDPSLN